MKVLLVIKLLYYCNHAEVYESERVFKREHFDTANAYYLKQLDSLGSRKTIEGKECHLMDVKAGHRKVK
jgi:hypothetical protein